MYTLFLSLSLAWVLLCPLQRLNMCFAIISPSEFIWSLFCCIILYVKLFDPIWPLCNNFYIQISIIRAINGGLSSLWMLHKSCLMEYYTLSLFESLFTLFSILHCGLFTLWCIFADFKLVCICILNGINSCWFLFHFYCIFIVSYPSKWRCLAQSFMLIEMSINLFRHLLIITLIKSYPIKSRFKCMLYKYCE